MATPKMILLALAAGSAAIATPAMAEWRSKEVQTSDLDLSNATGRAELHRRINSAVRFVCRASAARNPMEKREVRQCMAQSHATASAAMAQRIASFNNTKRAVTLASD